MLPRTSARDRLVTLLSDTLSIGIDEFSTETTSILLADIQLHAPCSLTGITAFSACGRR
jgi:hypothetical protein